ncbi:hypothetical protein DERP_001492 [Dermatophagoides pteronyssinus]|uniref:Uncharacterized protein n=1 Tax=Dermatophagoides pteronyssinus TaxID=6956 RepID=A0ABQ8JF49_DERPT|nr:hypothetical protein DERP_001492 [Dermatophagoides pteronyssinus]
MGNSGLPSGKKQDNEKHSKGYGEENDEKSSSKTSDYSRRSTTSRTSKKESSRKSNKHPGQQWSASSRKERSSHSRTSKRDIKLSPSTKNKRESSRTSKTRKKRESSRTSKSRKKRESSRTSKSRKKNESSMINKLKVGKDSPPINLLKLGKESPAIKLKNSPLLDTLKKEKDLSLFDSLAKMKELSLLDALKKMKESSLLNALKTKKDSLPIDMSKKEISLLNALKTKKESSPMEMSKKKKEMSLLNALKTKKELSPMDMSKKKKEISLLNALKTKKESSSMEMSKKKKEISLLIVSSKEKKSLSPLQKERPPSKPEKTRPVSLGLKTKINKEILKSIRPTLDSLQSEKEESKPKEILVTKINDSIKTIELKNTIKSFKEIQKTIRYLKDEENEKVNQLKLETKNVEKKTMLNMTLANADYDRNPINITKQNDGQQTTTMNEMKNNYVIDSTMKKNYVIEKIKSKDQTKLITKQYESMGPIITPIPLLIDDNDDDDTGRLNFSTLPLDIAELDSLPLEKSMKNNEYYSIVSENSSSDEYLIDESRPWINNDDYMNRFITFKPFPTKKTPQLKKQERISTTETIDKEELKVKKFSSLIMRIKQNNERRKRIRLQQREKGQYKLLKIVPFKKEIKSQTKVLDMANRNNKINENLKGKEYQ